MTRLVRAAIATPAALALACVAWTVAGGFDAAAIRSFSDGVIDARISAGVAADALIVITVAACIATTLRLFSSLARRAVLAQARPRPEWVLAVAGMVAIGLGLLHHQSVSAPDACCGSPSEAAAHLGH